MRIVALLLFVVVIVTGAEAQPAPATVTSTDGAGPTASARSTESTLAADHAWAAARKNAELQARARAAAAERSTAQAVETRGPLPDPTAAVLPGLLASLVEQDEVALLIELQRRRKLANGGASSDLLAAEWAAAVNTATYLPRITTTPIEPDAVAHPGDAPHPGPQSPAPNDFPLRPERLPAR